MSAKSSTVANLVKNELKKTNTTSAINVNTDPRFQVSATTDTGSNKAQDTKYLTQDGKLVKPSQTFNNRTTYSMTDMQNGNVLLSNPVPSNGKENIIAPTPTQTEAKTDNGGGSGGGATVAVPQYAYTPISSGYSYTPIGDKYANGYTELTYTPYEYNALNYDPLQYREIQKADAFAPSESYLKAMEYTNGLLQQLSGGKTEYTDKLNATMDEIAGRGEFQYDFNTDPMFQSALQSSMREGRTAMQDTMGQAAALTGGYGSTYATAVGSQAYNNYVQAAYDNLPQYQQMALDVYNAQGDELYRRLSMYQSADESAYNKLNNAYSQNYQNAQDQYAREYNNYWDKVNYDYNVDAQNIANQMSVTSQNNEWAMRAAEALNDYNKTNAQMQMDTDQFNETSKYNYAQMAQEQAQFDAEMAYRQAQFQFEIDQYNASQAQKAYNSAVSAVNAQNSAAEKAKKEAQSAAEKEAKAKQEAEAEHQKDFESKKEKIYSAFSSGGYEEARMRLAGYMDSLTDDELDELNSYINGLESIKRNNR